MYMKCVRNVSASLHWRAYGTCRQHDVSSKLALAFCLLCNDCQAALYLGAAASMRNPKADAVAQCLT
jgi:hypothetical protein